MPPILLALVLPSLSYGGCIPFDQARNHLDEIQCVTGKVIQVGEGDEGEHYLDFCEDHRLCTFTAVVFPHDLKKIGDVRLLAGKVVEIRGEIRESENGAEIILENSKQLSNGLLRLSPLPKALPKSFDVEERGRFSPGKSRRPRISRARKKKGVPTLPADLPDDAESE